MMRARYRLFAGILVISAAAVLVLQSGCARSGMTGGTPVETVDSDPDPAPEPVVDPAEEEKTVEVYDLEDEMLEDDEIDDQVEDLQLSGQGLADSFTVKDASEADIDPVLFDLGYRVQVFASSQLEKAKELKKNLMAGTGLAVYIEFEGGMYKVRVGDFLTRDEASKARESLLKEYPDCWIVSATIRK